MHKGQNERAEGPGGPSADLRHLNCADLIARLLALLPLLPAARLAHPPEVWRDPVRPGEAGIRPVLAGAEVAAVDHEPLLAALHVEDEFRHCGVRDGFEARAD